jgi:hypothetical protein
LEGDEHNHGASALRRGEIDEEDEAFEGDVDFVDDSDDESDGGEDPKPSEIVAAAAYANHDNDVVFADATDYEKLINKSWNELKKQGCCCFNER